MTGNVRLELTNEDAEKLRQVIEGLTFQGTRKQIQPLVEWQDRILAQLSEEAGVNGSE